MYCIRCGVELADSESRCPLCQTEVYHPEIEQKRADKPYPSGAMKAGDTFNPQGVLFLVTVGFALVAIICLMCDIDINRGIHWSGYVLGGLILGYGAVVLPSWFRNANPVIFVPSWFAAAALFLLYINYRTDGDWFLTLALPVTAFIGIVITAAIALYKYLRRGYLYITGGLIIALGIYPVFIELLIHTTFGTPRLMVWSMYPFTVLFIIGMALIIIAICKPLRQSLQKKFFV